MPKSKKRKMQQDEGEVEEVFTVEKVLNKRIGIDGTVEYRLKWMNYPETESTWEPQNNLDCPELIEAYEIKHGKKQATEGKAAEVSKCLSPSSAKKEKDKKTKKSRPPVQKKLESKERQSENTGFNGDCSVEMPDSDTPSGFKKGYETEEIMGATEMNGQILFLIKWKGIDASELVYSSEANAMIPQMVIKFYESKLTWHENSAVASES